MVQSSDILQASILIVDDQDADVALLEQMLRDAGYLSVVSTREPREVGELHRKNRSDLILLDLQTPGMDGFQVMENLKEIETGGHLPVLVIAAQPGDKLRALKAGAKDFITKPFDLADVLMRVHNLLEVRLLHRSENVLNHERLKNSQHIAGLGDWEYDFVHHRSVWSDEIYRILGILRENFPPVAETFFQRVHPDDLAFIYREKKAAMERSRRADFEYRIVRPGGEVRHIHQISEMILDDEGRAVRESGIMQDITERKHSEEALRQGEERYRKLLMLSPDAHFVYVDGLVTLVNQAFCHLMGAAGPQELLGRSMLEVIHPDSHGLMREPRRQILDDQPTPLAEVKFVRLDGTTVEVEVASVALDFGGRKETQVTARNITARKAAELALRESEQWLKAVFEQAAVGVEQIDVTTGRFLRVNQRLCNIVGYTREEMERLSFFEITHKEDIAVDLANLARIRDGAVREYTREKRYVRKDGSIVWVSLAISVIATPGKAPVSSVAIVQDITQRKQIEREIQRQAAFARFNPNPVLELSAAGEITYFNNAAREMACTLGAQLPAQILPANIAVIVRDCLATGQLVRLETQSGGRTISWLFFPVTANQVVHCSAGDITERKRLDEYFLQVQKMEALGQFSGGVAHDFNNILTAIIGFAELAQLILKENPEVLEHLGSVLQAARRATALVRQILAFSRQQPPERRSIELQPVVLESLKLLRATIPSTIEFDTSIANDAPTVLADANQIHQILMNLGINAWHAMKDLPGRLQVKLERCVVDAAHARAQPRLRPGVYARLSVSDTGCGMDRATLRRIFEPFFTTKPPGVGTGLGLAVVHGIMDSHDGAIIVYSQPGEGAMFHLYFPAHAGEAAVTAAVEGPVVRGHGEQVLFVDDEALLVQLGQKMLVALGYEAEVTTQPATALALVRADPQRFALVLADQTMPGMTGLLLASQLRQIRPGLPIVLMTGYSASLTPERLEAAGIRQLLLKPTTLRSLGDVVHTALSTKIPL